VLKGDWDPQRYCQFRSERAQPFHDLLHRIPPLRVQQAADLGCGTGDLTRLLLDCWPEARIVGVDSSADMLRVANQLQGAGAANTDRLRFERADIASWRAPEPLDCLVANASLHWVPEHARLLRHLVGQLAPGGVLAVQMPRNRDQPIYRAATSLLAESPWCQRIAAEALTVTVESPAFYAHTLAGLGLQPAVWETIYQHALPSAAAIVEWLAGTTLRPVLACLDANEQAAFLAALTTRANALYPAGPAGVLFPFRRLFFVASCPDSG
tara:strand:- start:91699 stop:92502 length:804 start_codon:yes stop_codon:yes gene_type:complete